MVCAHLYADNRIGGGENEYVLVTFACGPFLDLSIWGNNDVTPV